MRRNARLLSLALLTFTAACDPSSMPSVKNIAGWWYNDDGKGTQTIFGFEAAEDSPWELPLAENMVDAGGKPASAVYLVQNGVGPLIKQLATWDVAGDAIHQTVLADENALPGTEYLTKIYGLQAGKTMELQSKNDPSGKRAYAWYPRCPLTDAAGWIRFGGYDCPVVVSIGTSIAIDARGEVHALSTPTIGGGGNCTPAPTVTDLTRGCIARQAAVAPFGAGSSMITADDVWRVAMFADKKLVVRERAVRGTTWTEAVIDPSPEGSSAALAVKLLEAGGQRVVVFVTTDGQVKLYRGAKYAQELPAFPGGGNRAPFVDVDMGSDGRLVLLTKKEVLQETAQGWTATALPKAFLDEGGGTVRVVGGKVHAAWAYGLVSVIGNVAGGRGVYAILDGQAWTTTELGPMLYPNIVSVAGGPKEVVAAAWKSAKPALVHVTAGEGGVLASETVDGESTIGVGGSLPTWLRQPIAVRGPEGSIAATVDGINVFVRAPGTLPPADAQVHLRFVGMGAGRVRSLDGRIDCAKDCDVTLPRGTRLPVVTEPEPGSLFESRPCTIDLTDQVGWCWLEAVSADQTFNIRLARTTIRSRLVIGDGPASGADRFQIHGDRIALAAVFNAGNSSLPIGPDVFDTGDKSATVGLAVADRRTHTGWARSLPVAAIAVAPADDGGAYAILDPRSAIKIDGKNYGAPGNEQPLLVRFDAKGAAVDVLTLATMPQGGGSVAGAAVAPDGTAVVLVTATVPLAALGIAEKNAVLWRAPGGAVRVVGVAGESWSQPAPIAIEGDRAIVAAGEFGTAHLIALQAGAVTGRRDVMGGNVLDAAIRGTRLLATFTALGAIDLGAGPRNDGGRFVAEYDATGALRAAAPVEASTYYGMRATDDGAILVTSKVAQAYGANLAPGGMTLMPSPPLGQKMTAGPGDVGVAVILVTGGFILYDFAPAP